MQQVPLPDAPRVLAECRQHCELIDAIRNRMVELNVSAEVVNDTAGLAQRYLSKIIAPMSYKPLSTANLWLVLQTLGMKFLVVEDAEALARIGHRLTPRKSGGGMHSGTVHIVFSRRFLQRIRRKGGENSRKYLTPEYASELGRKAAQARWGQSRNGR